jgi:hypothetical protein
MAQLPWNLIIPGIVEVTREVIKLFGSRKGNDRRRKDAATFLKAQFPDIPDHLVNLMIELVVYGYKRDFTEEEIAAFLKDLLAFIDEWFNKRNDEQPTPQAGD